MDEWLKIIGALGGLEAIRFTVTFLANRKTNARKEKATADSMELQNLLSIIDNGQMAADQYVELNYYDANGLRDRTHDVRLMGKRRPSDSEKEQITKELAGVPREWIKRFAESGGIKSFPPCLLLQHQKNPFSG